MTTQKQVSLFLDELRESGVCNMFGAGQYVREAFDDLSKSEVSEMVVYWMKNFGK